MCPVNPCLKPDWDNARLVEVTSLKVIYYVFSVISLKSVFVREMTLGCEMSSNIGGCEIDPITL